MRRCQIINLDNLTEKQKIAGVVGLVLIAMAGYAMGILGFVGSLVNLLAWIFAIKWMFKIASISNDQQRKSMLAPVWKKYPVNCQIVFSKVRDVLRDSSYGFGDKWNVVSAEVQTNKIIADLKLTDNQPGVPLKVFIRLVAQIDIVDNGKASILKLSFDEQSMGRAHEISEVINNIKADIDAAIGNGETLTAPFIAKLPPAPDILINLIIANLAIAVLQYAGKILDGMLAPGLFH